MSDSKYIITHDGDVLANDLSGKDAVLFAAQYDGWGAEFAREAEGGMALRQSPRHIGNNPWLARGTEPALFGEISRDTDDEAAIEAVVEALISKIEKCHKLMTVETAMDYIKSRLQCALDDYEGDTGPGEWTADEARTKCHGDSSPALCYKWPDDMSEDHPDFGDSDAPWKKWGGDKVIESAGCSIVDGIAMDGYDCALVELK